MVSQTRIKSTLVYFKNPLSQQETLEVEDQLFNLQKNSYFYLRICNTELTCSWKYALTLDHEKGFAMEEVKMKAGKIDEDFNLQVWWIFNYLFFGRGNLPDPTIRNLKATKTSNCKFNWIQTRWSVFHVPLRNWDLIGRVTARNGDFYYLIEADAIFVQNVILLEDLSFLFNQAFNPFSV